MDAPKLSPYRWAVLACVCGVCFMANYMQYQVSVWGVVVMETLGIQVGELQTLMLMPMLAAVFLAIPAGTLADRFGVKRVVAVGLTVAVVAGFARAAFLDSFAIQIATMFGLGFGISTLNANMPKILGIWFKHKMTVAVGIFYAVSCVAIVMAQSVSTLFPDLFATYIVAAFALLAVCVCWYLFVRNHPAGEALPEPEPVTKYLGTAAKSKNVWFIALVYGLTLASTTGFSTIFPAMMEIVRGYDMTLSGNLAAVGTIGSFFACFVGPAWVQKSGKNKPFLIVTTVLGAITMAAVWWIQMGPSLWGILIVSGFLTACSGPIIEAMTYQLPEIGAKYAGSAGGIVTTTGLAMSWLLPIVVTFAVGENFMVMVIAYAALFLLSLLFIVLLPETGLKAKTAAEGVEAQG